MQACVTFPANGRAWVRWALDPVHGLIDGLTWSWREGVVTQVEPSSAPPRDLDSRMQFNDHILTPGLLNAHCHLDYSYLAGVLPAGVGFVPWLRAMIGARREAPPGPNHPGTQAVPAAIDALIDGGCTEVWDIDSFGWGRSQLRRHALASIHFLEWMAINPATWQADWQSWLDQHLDLVKAHPDLISRLGCSPHASYTVCHEAQTACARWLEQHDVPLAIHLAESVEEQQLLTQGTGGLADLFREVSSTPERSDALQGKGAFERSEQAGLLRPGTLAIHGNQPEPEDFSRLAESGAAVVFCPASHAFFGYPDFPLDKYDTAQVPIILGSDSLASSRSLSMRHAVELFAQRASTWSPGKILASATGANLKGKVWWSGRGTLAPSSHARWALWKPKSLPCTSTLDSVWQAWLEPNTRLAASSATVNYTSVAES